MKAFRVRCADLHCDGYVCGYVLARTQALARSYARRTNLGDAELVGFADLRADRAPLLDDNKALPIDVLKMTDAQFDLLRGAGLMDKDGEGDWFYRARADE